MKVDIIVTSNNKSDYDPKYLQSSLSDWQFNVSKLCFEEKSSDGDKIENLLSAINSDSDVVLAMRGGSGATRLMVDLQSLPNPPKEKVIVGYSDLTVLLNYLNRDPLITSIHGPMAFELTTESRIKKLQSAINQQNVKFAKPAKWLVPGTLEGKVVGGNLLLIINSIGTFYQPDFKDKILLIEEIDEPIDKLDRMFAQLRDCGILTEISGILLGNFKNCATPKQLEQLFTDYFGGLNIPVLSNLNFGHIDDSDYITLNKCLKIDENGIQYI